MNYRNSNSAVVAVSLLFACIGGWLVRDSGGDAFITWMYVFGAEDIVGWDGLINFYKNLRIAVSPFWSLIEIFSYKVFGDYRITAIWLYRMAIVGSFLMAGLMFKKSMVHSLISLIFGLYFIAAVVQIHPGNPVVADFFFPGLVLLYYLTQTKLRSLGATSKWFVPLSVALGMILTLLELTRPFVLVMVPFIMAGTIVAIPDLRKKALLAYLLPIVLLSGSWHVHHWINFNHVAWTNHSGINLMRAWDPIMGDWQSLEEQEEPPLAPGRQHNINTEVHSRNSEMMKRMVVEGMIEHPKRTLVEAKWLLQILLDGKTKLMLNRPDHWILKPYKAIIRIVVGFFVLGLICLAVRLVVDPGSRWELLKSSEVQLIGVMVLSIFAFSFGEKGEEARFLLSLLPLFSVFPMVTHIKWTLTRLKAGVKKP